MVHDPLLPFSVSRLCALSRLFSSKPLRAAALCMPLILSLPVCVRSAFVSDGNLCKYNLPRYDDDADGAPEMGRLLEGVPIFPNHLQTQTAFLPLTRLSF